MTDRGLDVVVLAGGKNSPEMEAATGVTNRALVPLGETTMLGYVIKALCATPSVGRLFVVGDVPADSRYQCVSSGKTLMDNLLAGLHAANAGTADRHVLVTTSDTPFLQAAAIADFIAQSQAAEGDLCYPIVPIALCRAQFPEMKRTTLRLREGTFTGGNMMLINPRFILDHEETVLKAYAARKSVSQIGRLLGWGLLIRILAAQAVAPGMLSLAMLESGVSRLIGSGCRARAIITHYPEIGTDVDKPEDVQIARRILGAAPAGI